MKYMYMPAMLTTQKGAVIAGFRRIAVDTPKNLAFIEKRKAIAAIGSLYAPSN